MEIIFFFSSRRRHTRFDCDWSSDVCSSDLHAGDMPSLLVTADGHAWTSFLTDRFTLDELRDGDGSAVMVHAGKDNFANIRSEEHRVGKECRTRWSPRQ